MILASSSRIAKITTEDNFHCAAINAEVARISEGRVPCYAVWGRRSIQWVSVGSSAVIGNAAATKLLERVGVNLRQVELTA